MNKLLATLTVSILFATSVHAEVKTKTIAYKQGGAALKGFLAYDDAVSGKRPGVLIVHEWWGLNDYAQKRARQLAKMGYVAFCVDMYGDGKVTEHPKTAGKWAGMIRKNTKQWEARALAGLKVLKDFEGTDGKRIAAIGYCFGGSTALQLAFTGADIDAVVSFHGAPVAPETSAKKIKTKVLFCHGASDGFIPDEKVNAMRAALDKGEADYQIVYYAGAKHSFTVPGADKRGIPNIAYNAAADRRSWQHMRMLFAEVFGESTK